MKRQQQGSTVAAAMMVLAALSALALAAAASALTALSVLGYQQQELRAFEAAEAAIAAALRRPGVGILVGPNHLATTSALGLGPTPAGSRLGAGTTTLESHHFLIVAEGRAGRGARVVLEQGYQFIREVPCAGCGPGLASGPWRTSWRPVD